MANGQNSGLGNHPVVVCLTLVTAIIGMIAACIAITVFVTGKDSLPEILSGINSKDADYYVERGDEYLYQGNYKQAIADYDKAIELDPSCATAYNNRGITYRKQGDYERAIVDHNKAIELEPDYATAYNNRGNVYYDQGNYEQAIANYNKAIELDPDYAYAYWSRGLTYKAIGFTESALSDLQHSLELNLDSSERETVEGTISDLQSKLNP